VKTKNVFSGVLKRLALLENPEKIQNKYPLYWLAPTTDLGVRQIRLRSLLIGDSQYDNKCNVIRFPRAPKILKYFLSFLGLAAKKEQAAPIRVAKLGNLYFVEKGIKRLRLAILLNLEYVTVNLVYYNYLSLKNRMRICKLTNINVIKLACPDGNGYDCYAVSPAHIEVLIKRHKVKEQNDESGHTAIKSVAGMEPRSINEVLNGTNNTNKLYLAKK
jgi:hypothetical protein